MKYATTCDHCGTKKVAYSHKLNRALVSALKQLVEFYERRSVRANIDKDLKLTYNQASNFQKLRYWGLVHRNTDGWVPTEKGTAFVRDQIKIPDTAGSLLGEPLEPIHEAWRTHKKEIRTVGVYDFIEVEYKKRPAYQQEHPTNLSLFSFIS